MNKLFFVALFLLSFSLISCEEKRPLPTSETSISGYLDNIPGTQLTLAHQSPEGIFSLDTTWVAEDGYFEFNPEVDEIKVYRVMVDFSKYLTVAVKKGDHITLEANGLDFYDDYFVSGSKESELIKVVVDETMRVTKIMDSIKVDINHFKGAKNSKGLYDSFEAQKKLYADFNKFSVDFINQYPGSIAAYFVVTGLQPDENPQEFVTVADNLNKTYPKFDYLDKLNDQASFLKRAPLEALAPELNFPTPEGDLVALSSLRGKYVLIDFWASWCRPCRMENPNVLRIYNHYKDKGFEIYGYSLDDDKTKWTTAIEEDQLPWINTSDLMGWSAEGAQEYGVQAIPATFLIGPDGKIISRDLKGEKLASKLAEIFGE